MLILDSIRHTARGVVAFLQGCLWLKEHPKHAFVLFLPIVISAILMLISWGFFFSYHNILLDLILFDKPETWWGIAFFHLTKWTLSITLFILSLLFYPLLTNIIASPIYEYISCAVEADLKGHVTADLSFLHSLRLIGEEIKKALFIFTISMIVLFIPGVNLLSPLITAFFVGWEFCDFPLARKGNSFKQRLSFMVRHLWSVLGFGLWLVIPIIQIVFMPLAVAGGTMLTLKNIKENKLTLISVKN